MNADADPDRTAGFLEGYLRAWTSNAPDDIRAIFTEDARYFPDPWREPWRGHEGIVENWTARGDDQGSWRFEWTPLVETEEVSVVQGKTTYASGTTFSNLWVIRLAPDGRAREFTEWWMDEADPSS